MEETVDNMAVKAIGIPDDECEYWQAANGVPLSYRTDRIGFRLVPAVIRSPSTTSSAHWIFMACSCVLEWQGQTKRNIFSIGFVTASKKPCSRYTCMIWPM